MNSRLKLYTLSPPEEREYKEEDFEVPESWGCE